MPTSQTIRDKVPLAVTQADQIPARRYYDAEFYELEKEKLWPRVWQMACRLDEIPRKGDYSVYEIFDQSVIITRVDDDTIKAYHNHCRHRGVKLVEDRGRRPGGFVCPFHGWRWALDGSNTFVFEPDAYRKENMCDADLALVEVKHDIWGGCVFINFDNDAPPLRDSIEPFATIHDAWRVEHLHCEWWVSARLPVNWKLAMEAFMEGYHVATTHPQLLPFGATNKPGGSNYVRSPTNPMTRWTTVSPHPMPDEIDPKEFIEMNIHFMRVLNKGMAGMTHEQDIQVAESLRNLDLPRKTSEAAEAWRTTLNDAVVEYYRGKDMVIGDLNEVYDKGYATSVNFCFPHFFLLPTFGSASSYRIRPLGPEECLFELWSLTRYPPGKEPPPPKTPTPMRHDDPRYPQIPKQDYSNLPKQQLGLHTGGFEFMRLSDQMEGLISNYHRLIDGYLADYDYDKLVAAAHKVSGCIDAPVKDLGL